MLPTFFGLNAVTRALLAQQEAVDIVNQNISNASTPGYSRQKPIITAFDPYTMPAFNRPILAGQIGTGAVVTKVDRFVDEMLNSQIRAGSQNTGQFQVMDDLFTHIQAIFSDPSNQAINTAAINFYNAVHALSNNPESPDARMSLEQQGVTLSNSISTRYAQLTTLQQDLNNKVRGLVADINNTVGQIALLNNQIAQVQGVGDNANDLMDKRDLLVDHLSVLVDTRVVKNPDGTDTVQMNGRFLVNKDQAYTLTTLTDASSPALIKPVKVFWDEDVTKFRNMHPANDPITGKNVTTGAPLTPAESVPLALISTGQLAGTLQIRDDVIQNTLLPQLNQLADSLTNTQALSTITGLKANQALTGTGVGANADSFVVTVMTPQGTAAPPGPGQIVTFNVGGALPANATVQNVIDAINSSSVAPYVHASLNSAGQLQIDTTQVGALVKVDQANNAASKDFGFSPTVADGFNFVQVQGYGLNTPAQFTGGISGLTLGTNISTNDTLTVTGPDGVSLTITVPTAVAPATSSTVQDLITAINAKGLSHGFQAALDRGGHLTIFAAPTVYGTSGQQVGTAAQVTSSNTTSLSTGTALTVGSTLSFTGPGGPFTFTAAAGQTVNNLVQAINAANVGVVASVNSVGQLQLSTNATGSSQSINVTAATGDFAAGGAVAMATGTTTGLSRGYPPSSTLTATTASANSQKDFFGNGGFPAPVTATNINQFFFQGAGQRLTTQVVAPTSTAGPFTIVQPAFPAQLSLSVIGATAFAAGAKVSVTGVDAVTGATVTDDVFFNANGVGTTLHFFRSVTGITTTGITAGQLQVVANYPVTQADSAGAMAVDAGVLKDPNLIATSNVPSAPGNELNALALLNTQQQGTVTNGLVATTVGDYYAGTISALGQAAQHAHTSRVTNEQLVQHIQNQKQSIVGVSLDEEAAQLVALQHAYQAAARAITTQDSMLDTIINGMGLVGRA